MQLTCTLSALILHLSKRTHLCVHLSNMCVAHVLRLIIMSKTFKVGLLTTIELLSYKDLIGLIMWNMAKYCLRRQIIKASYQTLHKISWICCVERGAQLVHSIHSLLGLSVGFIKNLS